MKGTHVFSYKWDKIAGHFVNVKSLASSNGKVIHGHSDDGDLAEAIRSDMVTEQESWYGEGIEIVDVNAVLGKPILTTLELLLYFADHKIFPIDSITDNGGDQLINSPLHSSTFFLLVY